MLSRPASHTRGLSMHQLDHRRSLHHLGHKCASLESLGASGSFLPSQCRQECRYCTRYAAAARTCAMQQKVGMFPRFWLRFMQVLCSPELVGFPNYDSLHCGRRGRVCCHRYPCTYSVPLSIGHVPAKTAQLLRRPEATVNSRLLRSWHGSVFVHKIAVASADTKQHNS